MKLRFLLALLVAFGLGMVSVANADIMGEFEDANGYGTDTYVGVAGDGWGGAWVTDKSNASCAAYLRTNGVEPYTQFDGNNYLDMKNTGSASVAGGKAAVYRNCMGTDTNAGDVDFTQDYTIAFSVRADDLTSFTALTDEITIFANPTTTDLYNPTTASSFMLKVTGSNADPTRSLEWYFLDGPRGTTDPNGSVRSGIYLAASHIYDFVVTVHPLTDGYDVVLTDRSTSQTYSTFTDTTQVPDGDLGWRGTNDGKYLSFSSRVSAKSEVFTYSVDSIRIAQVPEPSTLVLLASALLGLLIWRRK